MATTPLPELITVAELAAWVRSTTAAIHVQRHRGQLPGALGMKVGKKVLFDRREVEDFLASQRQEVADATDPR